MSSKLANLHAGLIARKGEATPAIVHPAFSYVDAPRPARQPVRQDGEGVERHQFKPPAVQPRDQRLLHGPRGVPAPPPPEPVSSAPASKPAPDDHSRPYRITLRMTVDQRRRLRIAAAKEETTLQALLSEALDSHLDTLCACALRDCTCLARDEGQL